MGFSTNWAGRSYRAPALSSNRRKQEASISKLTDVSMKISSSKVLISCATTATLLTGRLCMRPRQINHRTGIVEFIIASSRSSISRHDLDVLNIHCPAQMGIRIYNPIQCMGTQSSHLLVQNSSSMKLNTNRSWVCH